MKKQVNRLKLNRETLRSLSMVESKRVGGARYQETATGDCGDNSADCGDDLCEHSVQLKNSNWVNSVFYPC